ncbi:MAG TPA: hypothetical protein DCS30_12020, partial [Rhizobiales bacterium]|nr:hypothetical protein [Hyphomicrobiales bacterium]
MLAAARKPSVDDIRSMDDPEKLVEIVLTASKEGWLGDDWLAARAAVDRLGKMSSVKQLQQITLKVPNHQLRYAALDHLVLNLDKISDTKLLTQLSDRLMDPTPTFGFIREVRKETKQDLLLSILKRTKDQVLLAAIVQKYRFGNDPFILEAIANLEDPDILKSLLNDTAANWDRKQAVLDQVTKLGDRITDPRLWSEVAKRQYIDDDTRLDAIGRVGNTELLLEVADRFTAHRYSKIPSMVFDHIEDQDDLLAIALDRERAVKLRSLAIEKLTEYDALLRVRSGLNSDQNHLNYIALSGLKNDIKNRLVEMAQQSDDEAIIADLLTQNLNYVGRGTRDVFREKLANGIVKSQALIAKVAIYGWETRAREIAVELLEDDAATLKQVAMNDKQGFVRQAAIKKIDDQKFLAELALSDTVRSYYLSNAATKRITNSSLLADIVKNVRWNETRMLAIERIDDSVIFASLPDAPDHWNEEALKALQTKRQEFLVSATAVTDPTILLQMAKSHPSHELRLVAVKKLDNQKALAEIA